MPMKDYWGGSRDLGFGFAGPAVQEGKEAVLTGSWTWEKGPRELLSGRCQVHKEKTVTTGRNRVVELEWWLQSPREWGQAHVLSRVCKDRDVGLPAPGTLSHHQRCLFCPTRLCCATTLWLCVSQDASSSNHRVCITGWARRSAPSWHSQCGHLPRPLSGGQTGSKQARVLLRVQPVEDSLHFSLVLL